MAEWIEVTESISEESAKRWEKILNEKGHETKLEKDLDGNWIVYRKLRSGEFLG